MRYGANLQRKLSSMPRLDKHLTNRGDWSAASPISARCSPSSVEMSFVLFLGPAIRRRKKHLSLTNSWPE